MKSVLHIGFDAISHSKEGLRKGFLAAGFTEYHFMNWQNLWVDVGILGCQGRMIQAAKNLKPDLIFLQIQIPGILDEETVIELSKCGFTVNYTFDVRDSEKTEWLYELAPHFGLTLFACKEDADEARRRGINNVGNIHSSCDPDLYRPISLSEEEKKKHPEIVFIGNNRMNTNMVFERSQEREEMVNFMKAEFGNRFGVFGLNWGAHSRIIDPSEEVKIYNSAKVVVCHNNYLREEYCSDRQWRAMACGAAVVFHSYPGLNDDVLYDPPSWSNLEQIYFACSRLLVNTQNRQAIASSCRMDFKNMNMWQHRIESIKKMIWNLKSSAKTHTG